MSLSSLQLDAFYAVVGTGSFSGAAKKLGLTQSALSQRVLNLEQELGTDLFVRDPAGVRPTEQGLKLARYCQSRKLLEDEFLTELKSDHHGELRGPVRVGGFSTLNSSILVPLFSRFKSEHPGIQVLLQRKELRELPRVLISGEVDFIFTTQAIERPGIETVFLGYEENVLIHPAGLRSTPDHFLDHDEEDTTSFDFFRHQGQKNPKLKRSYLGGIEAILEGVRSGLGSAIVPRHLIQNIKGIEINQSYKPLRFPVSLCYHTQSFYTALQKESIERFRSEIPIALKI